MFLIPRFIEKRRSAVNGTIEVYKFLNDYSLRVERLTQSGGLVEEIWGKAMKEVYKQQVASNKIGRVLILGLGGGTVARLTARFWPEATMVGVEIDPVMIELGEKYFDLRQLKNLRVVRRDAFEWLGSNRGKFDLILVDLYLGRRVPKRAETRKFLYRLRDRLKTKRGAILFNRLKLKD